MLAEQEVLSADGAIWLPNLACVQDLMKVYGTRLSEYYTWDLEKNPNLNPLYRATEKVEKELLLCPDSLTNETQMRPLFEFSETPFFVLRRWTSTSDDEGSRKGETFVPAPAPAPATPRRSNSSMSSSSQSSQDSGTDHEDNSSPESTKKKKFAGRSVVAADGKRKRRSV